jgi:hypothetical protein
MNKTYKGKYKVKNPKKYKGDVNNVVYRSGWERDVMVYLDDHTGVAEWNSEDFIIRYFYEVDKKNHNYHMDFWIKFTNGTILLVEVKPKRQTEPPKSKNPRSKRGLTEAFAYIKNRNKWDAAEKVAKDNGYGFVIWTEVELTEMGILKKTPGTIKKLKPMTPYRKKKKKT